jgi:hypothetical protein
MSDTLREQIAEILWEEIRRQHGRDVPAIAADRILALIQPAAEIARLREELKAQRRLYQNPVLDAATIARGMDEIARRALTLKSEEET